MNKLLMFDLDGTLIDSRGGIAAAVNAARQFYGFPPLPLETVISYVGNGAKILMERATSDISLPVPQTEILHKMLDFYAAEPVAGTVLYPQVTETLAQLQQQGWIMAVISNKPQFISTKILDALDIARFISDNIGDGGSFPLKPAPDAIFHLMKKYDVSPENCWFAGDNYTDICAAVNAGIKSVFCEFGIGKKADSVSTVDIREFSQLPAVLTN